MESRQVFRTYSSLVQSTWLSWDYALTLSDEYTYIWKSRSTPTKWLYLFSRYSGIGANIGNLILLNGPLAASPIRLVICRNLFLFYSVIFVCHIAALEGILALRIYALYLRTRRIFAFLIILIISNFSMKLGTSIYTAHHLHYDDQCIGFNPPKLFAVFDVSIIGTQILLCGLIIYKKRVAEREGWDQPILEQLVRDNLCIAIALTLMVCARQPFAYIKHLHVDVMCLWPSTLFVISTYRLILNMSRLKTEGHSTEHATTFSTLSP